MNDAGIVRSIEASDNAAHNCESFLPRWTPARPKPIGEALSIEKIHGKKKTLAAADGVRDSLRKKF